MARMALKVVCLHFDAQRRVFMCYHTEVRTKSTRVEIAEVAVAIVMARSFTRRTAERGLAERADMKIQSECTNLQFMFFSFGCTTRRLFIRHHIVGRNLIYALWAFST